MNEISIILLFVGVLIALAVLNAVFGIISKINVRTLFVFGLIITIIVIASKSGQLSAPDKITGAVLKELDEVIPVYMDSGMTCDEVQKLVSEGKSEKSICDEICYNLENIGNKCSENKFFCKCW